MKYTLCTVFGVAGAVISYLFGAWSTDLVTLLIMMAADWVSGMVVAGVFKNSNKTENGSLNSSVGIKGLWKKAMMLIIVLVSQRMDLTMGTDCIRNGAIVALVVNEAISIIENLGLMGVRVPEPLTKAIEVLAKDKEGDEKK